MNTLANPNGIASRHGIARRNGLFIWAVGGVVLLLGQAMWRLGSIAWEAIASGQMSQLQLVLCGGWIVSNCYLEGYRGFQKRFVPRVLARAHHLCLRPELGFTFSAPLFSMAFFRATAKAKYAAYGVTGLVLIAIAVVRSLPQPWRGIIDAGVVAGLLWGTVILVVGAVQRLRGVDPTGDPELDTHAL